MTTTITIMTTTIMIICTNSNSAIKEREREKDCILTGLDTNQKQINKSKGKILRATVDVDNN